MLLRAASTTVVGCWACLLLQPIIVVLLLPLLRASWDFRLLCLRARVRLELPRVN